MRSVTKKILAVIMLYELAGCAGVTADQLHVYNGMVTVGGEGNRFEEVPVTSVSQKQRFFVITHVRWDGINDDAGVHAIDWQWFLGDQLVAERKSTHEFKHTPYRFWYAFPAADFAVGHYRVNILIDGKIVDTQQFDITQ